MLKQSSKGGEFMRYCHINKPVTIDCTHFDENIQKFSIPVYMDPWMLYDLALRVYLANNKLCLAAKANQDND